MSTRAVYSFRNTDHLKPFETHIYKHHDGSPKWALKYIYEASNEARVARHQADLSFGKYSGRLNPTDSMICGFLTSRKVIGPRNITSHWKNHPDINYRYLIRSAVHKSGRTKDQPQIDELDLYIKIYHMDEPLAVRRSTEGVEIASGYLETLMDLYQVPRCVIKEEKAVLEA